MRAHYFLPTCILSCLTFCELAAAAPADDWQLISQNDNVTLFRRERPLAPEFKAIGEIDAPSEIVQAVISDLDSYPKFMPFTPECRVLKREGDSVLAYERIAAPLCSDRDYTLRIRRNSKNAAAGRSYSIQWTTDNAHGLPEKSGVVRVQLCEGGWLLEPAGANRTRATYQIYTDSGGAIPAFIKTSGSQIGIRKMFAAVRKQVRDPKYDK